MTLLEGQGLLQGSKCLLALRTKYPIPDPLTHNYSPPPSICNWLSRDVSWLTVYTTSLSPLNRAKAQV